MPISAHSYVGYADVTESRIGLSYYIALQPNLEAFAQANSHWRQGIWSFDVLKHLVSVKYYY